MSVLSLKARSAGRLELLAWLNDFLETDYSKVEHLGDGIAYCQVIDALYAVNYLSVPSLNVLKISRESPNAQVAFFC
jgi:hypothetical protein